MTTQQIFSMYNRFMVLALVDDVRYPFNPKLNVHDAAYGRPLCEVYPGDSSIYGNHGSVDVNRVDLRKN